MGFKFNPLIFSGLDISGGGGSAYWADGVNTEMDLPASGSVDGEARVVLSTDKIYIWDATSSQWIDTGLTLAAVGSTPNANGATLGTQVDGNITRTTLNLEPADLTNPGVVTTGTQSFNGAKTFDDVVTGSSGIETNSIDTIGANTLGIGNTNASIINLGNAGCTINFNGTVNNNNVTNLNVTDSLITINDGGGAGSASGAGIEVEENSTITGYVKTSNDRNAWDLKAPNTAGVAEIIPGAAGITLNQSSHDPVTLGTANGLSLSTQSLSLALSSSTTTGALSSTDWTTFNNKVSTTRTISTTAPLAGGGDLSADRTLSISQATTSSDGYLSSTDWNTFNSKQNALGYTPEDVANKATDFSVINNILYPTVQAVNNQINSKINGIFTFMFSGLSSDISGYYSAKLISLYTPGPETNILKVVTTTPTLMASFATDVGYPGITTIGPGIFTSHFEAKKLSNSHTFYAYAELYKRSSGGTETLLLTSDQSDYITHDVRASLTVTFDNTSTITLLSTDRLVTKIYCVLTAGSDTIDLYTDDNTNGRLELPSTALGYIPENVANKSSNTSLGTSDVLYPTQNAVKSYVDAGLGTKEPTITVLPISKGGTNSSTALNNNRIMYSSSGSIIEASAITANRALVSDVNGIPTHSSVTSTELGYVSGTTSSIQTQLNSKQNTVTGDIAQTSFTAADNQSSAADVTGFAFANASVRAFESIVSIVRDSTYAQYTIRGIQKAASWEMSQDFVGDDCGIIFSITTLGQIQYTSTNTGFSGTIKFRAWVTSV